jgi:hypothetical protein
MTFLRFAVVVVLATLALPSIAAAQRNPFEKLEPGPKRLDVSGSGGFLLPTDWSDLVLLGSVSPVSGALEQILVRDLVVDPGPVFDGTVTYWEGRYGFRAHAGFAQSCLAVGRTCGALTSLGEPISGVNVNTYMYDVGGAIGLIDYRPGRWAWPYAFFGIGAVTYDLDQSVGPPLTFIERRPARGADGQVIVNRDDPDTLLISIDEIGIETQLALNLGIGTDFRIPVGPASFGLRLELSDNMHASPVGLDIAALEVPGIVGRDTRANFGLVHNLRAAAGVVIQFGR